MRKKLNQTGGFSLVEVALALGIASFCLITLMALLPVGVQHYKQADTQKTMVNLASMVVRDLETTSAGTSAVISPRFKFSVPAAGETVSGTPQTLYVDAFGVATGVIGGAPTASSIYRLSLFFVPPSSSNHKSATQTRLLITFPANADSVPTTLPAKYSDMFETTVSLNRN